MRNRFSRTWLQRKTWKLRGREREREGGESRGGFEGALEGGNLGVRWFVFASIEFWVFVGSL